MQGHSELCRDGHPLVSPPRAEPSLPPPFGGSSAFVLHGTTAKVHKWATRKRGNTCSNLVWWWWWWLWWLWCGRDVTMVCFSIPLHGRAEWNATAEQPVSAVWTINWSIPAKMRSILGLATPETNMTQSASYPAKPTLHMPLPWLTTSVVLSFWFITAMMQSIAGLTTTEGNTARNGTSPGRPA